MATRLSAAFVALVAGLGTAVGGCGDEARPAAVRTAGAYAAIISWAVGALPPPKASAEPLVFVLGRPAKGIPLAVQAAVVQRLDGRVSVQFVDNRAEAVDAGADLDPVRRDGLLVTTGLVPPASRSVQIPVTLYRRSDLVQFYRLTVDRQAKTWAVTSAEETPRPA